PPPTGGSSGCSDVEAARRGSAPVTATPDFRAGRRSIGYAIRRMESLRELYRIGAGPSSSHAMGPQRAAFRFLERQPDAAAYRVTLYGSLAATGRGHLTDLALAKAFGTRPFEIAWKPDEVLAFHPNGMDFEALDASGAVLDRWRVFSVG